MAPPSRQLLSRVPAPLRGAELRELTQSIRRPRRFTFAALPVEIRHMIYRQIKNDEGEHLKPVTATYWNDHERAKSSKLQWHGRFTIHHGEANKTIWALVFTCQTIHDEALPYMYEGVRFVLPTATKEFGFRVPGLQYRLIFWLHVRIVADDFGWDRECLSILQLSDWGSCLDHLEISIHRPRKRLSVDEDTFMISFGDMIIDWEKIRMIRRVKFNVTGMDAGWVWDELEEAENKRLNKIHPEVGRNEDGDVIQETGTS